MPLLKSGLLRTVTGISVLLAAACQATTLSDAVAEPAAVEKDGAKEGQTAVAQPSRRLTPEQIDRMIARWAGKATDRVIYTGVTLFDGTGNAPQENINIIVEGEHIEAVLPATAMTDELAEGATVYNAKGLFALPGLIDSHLHLATIPDDTWASAILYRQIYGGITDVRDMAGDGRVLAETARRTLVNEIPGPDINYSALMAGPSFFADRRTVTSALGVERGKVPWMQGIEEETDLSLAVAKARGTSATGLKVYANLSGALVQDIINEAHLQGFPVWAHLQVPPATPYDSLGATSVSHVCSIARYAVSPEAGSYSSARTTPVSYDTISPDHPEIKKYIKALKQSGTSLDATLVIHEPPKLIDASSMKEEASEPEPERSDPCSVQLAGDLTHAMYKAGIPIIAGTDLQSEPADRYPALYYELQYLVDYARMTPADVIVAATSNAARVLGRHDEVGTIEAGKYANLILLRDNPLEDINNIRSITLTVKRGIQFPREEYEHQDIPEPDYPEGP